MKPFVFRLAAVPMLMLSAACSPLQQAPLVYSSKVVVGIDVSANVADNQGGSVNIGVKTIDSAYVPVGVSKEIDKSAKDKDKTVEIRLIEARYGEGSTPENSDPASIAERNRKIDEYFTAKKAADDAATRQADLEREVAGLSAVVAELEVRARDLRDAQAKPETVAPGAAPGTQTRHDALVDQAALLAKMDADRRAGIHLLTDQTGAFNTQEVLADLAKAIDTNKAGKAERESRLPLLKSQREQKTAEADRAKSEAARVAGLSQTTKTDAMSVYGRFDSNGAGGVKEGGSASLLIGKVFSTGLASQNLTEAVNLEAASHCIASGFEVAKLEKDDATRRQFIENLQKFCVPGLNNSKK